MGGQTAELLQTAVASSKSKSSGFLAAAIGIITLIVTASGVFGEMQAALNKVWKAEAKGTTVGRMVQARAKSLGLVAALGFLLMVSLAVSAALTAFAAQINAALPFGGIVLSALNLLVSLVLISFLFAAVFKVLPTATLNGGMLPSALLSRRFSSLRGNRSLAGTLAAALLRRRMGRPEGSSCCCCGSTIQVRSSSLGLNLRERTPAYTEADKQLQRPKSSFGLQAA